MKKILQFLLKNRLTFSLAVIFIAILISGFYLWKINNGKKQDKLIEYKLNNEKVKFLFVTKSDVVEFTDPLIIYKGKKTGEEVKVTRYSGIFNTKLMYVIFQKSEFPKNHFLNWKQGEYETWFKEEVDLRKSNLNSFKLLQFEVNEKVTYPYALVEYSSIEHTSDEGNVVIITKKKYVVDPTNGIFYEMQVNLPEKYRNSAEYINTAYKVIDSLIVNK